MEFYKLYVYEVPEWARHIKNSSTHFVKLSNLNTPLHRWNLADLPDGFEAFIKRDDLTGSELSGSKVRSLQFIFGDALNKGAKHILASGGIQSCLCRMVSGICRLLELTPHLLIDGNDKKDVLGPKGNALLYRMACSKIYVVPLETVKSCNRRLETLNQYLSDKYGENCYHIPRGGASVKGVNGFISLFEELLSQKLHERFDDIVITIGTGGTALGLAVANYLTGSKLRIHAVTIALSKRELCEVMDSLLTEMGLADVKSGDLIDIVEGYMGEAYATCTEQVLQMGLADVKSGDLIDIVEGYMGEAYATCTEQVLRFITKVSSTTGILLDPYYTGKRAMGMVTEMAINPSRFKGKRILFIHTGGIFGLFNGEMNTIIDNDGEVSADITLWPNEDISPMNV